MSELDDIFKELEEETVDSSTDTSVDIGVDLDTDTNDDGISDYYTKLLCEGKLRTGTGISIFEGIPYEKIQKNADYDQDGLTNSEELEITTDGDKVFVTMISNPKTKYSDKDAYTDYEEVKEYNTNPLASNIIIESDIIDIVYDETNYYAWAYEQEYNDSTAKQIAVWLGNNIYGSNYDKEEIYKDALIEYFQKINDERAKINEVQEKIEIIQQYGSALTLLVDAGRTKYKHKGETIDYLLDLQVQIEHLKDSVADLETSADAFSDDEFYKQYDKLQEYIKNLTTKSDDIKELLDTDVTIKGKMTTFAQGESAKKVIKTIDLSFNVLQLGLEIKKAVDDYSKLNSIMTTLQSNIYVLEVLAEKAYDENVKKAAESLLRAAQNDYSLGRDEVLQAIVSTGLDIALHTAITEIPVVGFWVEISIALGDLLFNVSDTAKYAIRLCGDSCMGFELAIDLVDSLDGFTKTSGGEAIYEMRGYTATAAVQKYMNLVELRQFGENDMIELQTSRPNWLSQLCDLLGGTTEEIVDSCGQTIEMLEQIKDRYSYAYSY